MKMLSPFTEDWREDSAIDGAKMRALFRLR